MDHVIPLEIAIAKKTRAGETSPTSQLLLAMDQLLKHEAGTSACRNLNKWRQFIAQKYRET
jgi:hypothetical protein